MWPARAGQKGVHPLGATAYIGSGSLRCLWVASVCLLVAVALLACTSGGEDSAVDERVLELEAQARSLEDRLAAIEEGQARTGERLDGFVDRLGKLEEATSKMELLLSDKDQWSKDKDEKSPLPKGASLERTAMMAEDSGGKVHYVEHAGRGERSVLVLPVEFVDGETPLIVSLHGFGGDASLQAAYVPLHERVNSDGFALLLPNGQLGGTGLRFWNPTDETSDTGKAGGDDVAYLTELVAEARKVADFGHVYFFGYSNGGFMAYHMACKGLPGLRAVASLAGTSYVEDSSCDGAPSRVSTARPRHRGRRDPVRGRRE